LLEIISAGDLTSLLAGFGEDREQDGGEDRNDGDDNEQLDEREVEMIKLNPLYCMALLVSRPLAQTVNTFYMADKRLTLSRSNAFSVQDDSSWQSCFHQGLGNNRNTSDWSSASRDVNQAKPKFENLAFDPSEEA
jgi:hypothetical protein